MVVGQSVNGWTTGQDLTTKEGVRRTLHLAQDPWSEHEHSDILVRYQTNPTGWISDAWSRDDALQGCFLPDGANYSSGRSSFWQAVRSIVRTLTEKPNLSNEEVFSKIAWSNIYRVAPARFVNKRIKGSKNYYSIDTGTVPHQLKEPQNNYVAAILETEIRHLQPDYLFMMIGKDTSSVELLFEGDLKVTDDYETLSLRNSDKTVTIVGPHPRSRGAQPKLKRRIQELKTR